MVHEAQLPQGFPPPGPIGQVIVKNYPACRAATVAASDVNGAGQDDMFRPLFDHIQRENIAMTAPLQMDFEWVNVPAGSTQPSAKPPTAMSFVYRSPRTGKPGKDGIVTVRDLPAVTVISVGVRGSYNAEHFDYGLKAITDWLRIHPNSYRVVGPPRFLGYNSPFVFAIWGSSNSRGSMVIAGPAALTAARTAYRGCTAGQERRANSRPGHTRP